MNCLDGLWSHLVGNRMISVSGEAVDAGSHQKMRSCLLCGAEQLVDVALAVSARDTALRLSEEGRGLPQVLPPAEAFLFFDGPSGGVNALLQRVTACELLSGPELHGGSAQRQSGRGHGQAGGPWKTAPHLVPWRLISYTADRRFMDKANGFCFLAMIGELRCVMQNQYRFLGRGREAFLGSPEMTGQEALLTDLIMRPDAIGRFRASPILASEPKAVAQPLRKLTEQDAKSLIPALVSESAACQFLIHPQLIGTPG